MRQCLFCDNKADSSEHVWPNWILEKLKSDRQMNVRGFIADRPIYWAGPKPELKTRFVCSDCNGGWMSNLETANQPLLGAMMRDITTPINPLQQWSLANWVVKTAMVFESVASKQHHPFYTKKERAQLRDTSALPNHTSIWLARHSGEPEIGSVGMAAWNRKPEDPGVLQVYVTTIVFQRLAIQVISARIPADRHECNIKVDVRPAPWDQVLRNIRQNDFFAKSAYTQAPGRSWLTRSRI